MWRGKQTKPATDVEAYEDVDRRCGLTENVTAAIS